MILPKMPASVETTTEVTSAEYASARRNRDALTLMSEDDRARFAGRYAVVVRAGESSGKVIGHGPTREDAVRMAARLPDYDWINCAVQFISPFAEGQSDGDASP